MLPPPANGTDIVGARVHGGDQARNLLGWILQIRIEGDHVATARLLEGGQDRHMLAGIARQHHHARDIRSALELFAQLRDRAVAAAVIDEYDLVTSAERLERRVEPLEQEREAPLSVAPR